MKPMLSHRYNQYYHLIKWPWYMQPKFNGIRMMYQDGVLQSRSYGLAEPRTWPKHRLRHLREALSELPKHFFLDGELYVHGWSLQKINGAAAINGGNDSERSILLEYHVFDVINIHETDEPFSERATRFPNLSQRFQHPIVFSPTHLVDGELKGDAQYAAWLSLSYEGAVYKDPAEAYGFSEDCGNKENRWRKTLKRKDYLDAQAKIIAVHEGEGKYENMVGSFRLRLASGVEFNAGSGLYDSQREEFWEDPPIGRFCQIKYLMLSDDGVPKEPIIEAVLD